MGLPFFVFVSIVINDFQVVLDLKTLGKRKGEF
jgi:hypothetical protein